MLEKIPKRYMGHATAANVAARLGFVAAIGLGNVACGGGSAISDSSSPETGNLENPSANGQIVLGDRTNIYMHVTNSTTHTVRHRAFLFSYADKKVPRHFGSRYYAQSENPLAPNPDYFVIEILVASSLENVRLLPAQVCLRASSSLSQCVFPERWLTPHKPYMNKLRANKLRVDQLEYWGNQGGPLCENAFLSRKASIYDATSFESLQKDDAMEVGSGGEACIALWFPIAPIDPANGFSVTLRNIALNGTRLSDKTIQFRPISRRVYWR